MADVRENTNAASIRTRAARIGMMQRAAALDQRAAEITALADQMREAAR